MSKEEWKKTQVRIEITEGDVTWSFPINCPKWLFKLIMYFEKH